MSDLIPMPEPIIEGFVTGPWYCDTCGRKIERPKDGWVEWLSNVDTDKAYGLRLVHHKPASTVNTRTGCQYDEDYEFPKNRALVQDMSLRQLLGSAGLMELLELLDAKDLPEAEVMEMIKRLHIKDYEQARGFFEEAISRGVFQPNSRPGFYVAYQIELVKEYADEQRAARGY